MYIVVVKRGGRPVKAYRAEHPRGASEIVEALMQAYSSIGCDCMQNRCYCRKERIEVEILERPARPEVGKKSEYR